MLIPRFSILFPGQGSQRIGMGQAFLQEPEFQACFNIANKFFTENLQNIIYQGTIEELTKTHIAQPALLTVEIGIFRVLSKHLESPACFAGHSLGEYSALVAAGALSFESAFQLVMLRGQLMQTACERHSGTMAAVIKADRELVEKVCQLYVNKVVIGNYNSPDQLVISGERQALQQCVQELKSHGIKRIIPLNVSGAFHSPLMAEAQGELEQAIENTVFSDTEIPVISNCNAQPATKADHFKENLKTQLIAPVLWQASIEKMAQEGVTRFVEIGPGQVLSNLVKRIVPGSQVENLGS